MRQLLIQLLMILTIISCGSESDFRHLESDSDPRTEQGVDPLLQEYIDSFERDYGVEIDFPVVFSKRDIGVVGTCTVWNKKYKQVDIDPDFYDKYKDDHYVIHQLIYHELGHCELNLGHVEGYIDKCPVSIMNPYTFGKYLINKCYVPKLKYYLKELL